MNQRVNNLQNLFPADIGINLLETILLSVL